MRADREYHRRDIRRIAEQAEKLLFCEVSHDGRR
ncbi:MAG: hypothetical protein K0S35_2938, partial [Geminicoccaceae bacterium]|nr:hypothetical protein [Geminicoccaceae bacterium]